MSFGKTLYYHFNWQVVARSYKVSIGYIFETGYINRNGFFITEHHGLCSKRTLKEIKKCLAKKYKSIWVAKWACCGRAVIHGGCLA